MNNGYSTKRLGLRAAALIACSLALAGCIGVKLSPQGSEVRQATDSEVGACTLVGKVSSNIPSKTLGRLSPGKVQEQLIVLARNEAPGLGGDTIVPAGPVQNGFQEFNVFRCR
jgi:hypothetical protein